MSILAPCLWFDDQAAAAASLYTSIFPNSRVLALTHYPDAGKEIHGKPAGSVMTVTFEIDGQRVVALNGGPQFKFSEAISMSIDCDSQAQLDQYWGKLCANGGKPGPCGWLTDRFGLSWQLTSVRMQQMLSDPDPRRAARAFAAVMKMSKLDLAAIERAYQGG